MSEFTDERPAPAADNGLASPASLIREQGAVPLAPPLPGALARVGKAAATAVRKFIRDATRTLDRETIARLYLRGAGLEIGALHEPLKVPAGVRVRYVDRLSTADLRRHYPELATLDLVEVDVVDDGERLATIADASEDFVIANQVLEHCQNPLATIEQWLRVLKPNGILFLSLPDKRFSFDVDRPVTTVDHVLRDYADGPAWSRRQHFEEWVTFVEKVAPEARAARVEELMRVDYSIHFHVWTQTAMLALVQAAQGLFGGLELELFLKTSYDVEHLIVLRKPASAPGPV
jgi:predicted SAM-dependent methyltransferase